MGQAGWDMHHEAARMRDWLRLNECLFVPRRPARTPNDAFQLLPEVPTQMVATIVIGCRENNLRSAASGCIH